MTDPIEIHSTAGVPIKVEQWMPESTPTGWAVVLCPGYGSIAPLMEAWGEALAALGHRCVAPWYRGYGDHPDQLGSIFPDDHVADVRSTIRWLRSESPVPRIAVAGVSYGGAMAIEAAGRETGVDAAISIVGYGSGARHLRAARRYHEWLTLLESIEEDRARRARTGRSARITLDEILLRDAHAQEWRSATEARFPGMRFDVTLESVDQLIEFAPERHLPFTDGTPLLIMHAAEDRMIPLEEAHRLYALAGEPKVLKIIPDADHHDVHRGEAFTMCIETADGFLEREG